ncbi:hypothetical protein Ddc_22512 [Ditylenchus destructor]|nr:hypothetical protein Ddc_22512 [Ditylenchus destructor]
MHRFTLLTEKQKAKPKNEAREKTKKSLSFNRISKITALDNGTMVESFKYLNYCQLATNSLVSKRYCDLIQTHRHKLALLNVNCIRMGKRWNLFDVVPPRHQNFKKELSTKEYSKWIVCNGYWKKSFILKISTAVNPPDYELSAYGDYKDQNQSIMSVFYTRIKELNHDTWPFVMGEHYSTRAMLFECLVSCNDLLFMLRRQYISFCD